MTIKLYTTCSDCGAVLIVEAEANERDLVRSDTCGFQEEVRTLRKPFRRQLDEGRVLGERRVVTGPRGYANA